MADNGGPTKTQLIGKGSPAIDVVPAGAAACSADAVDQRGTSRPQGGRCDIGAVEARQQPVAISPGSLPHGTLGVAYSATLRATGGLGTPYVFSLEPASALLPPGLTLRVNGTISGTPTKAGSYRVTISVDDPTLSDGQPPDTTQQTSCSRIDGTSDALFGDPADLTDLSARIGRCAAAAQSEGSIWRTARRVSGLIWPRRRHVGPGCYLLCEGHAGMKRVSTQPTRRSSNCGARSGNVAASRSPVSAHTCRRRLPMG